MIKIYLSPWKDGNYPKSRRTSLCGKYDFCIYRNNIGTESYYFYEHDNGKPFTDKFEFNRLDKAKEKYDSFLKGYTFLSQEEFEKLIHLK